MKEVITELVDLLINDTGLAKVQLSKTLKSLLAWLSNIAENLDDAIGGAIPVNSTGNVMMDDIMAGVSIMLRNFSGELDLSETIKEIIDYVAAALAEIDADLNKVAQAKPAAAAIAASPVSPEVTAAATETANRLTAAKAVLSTAPASSEVSQAISHIELAQKANATVTAAITPAAAIPALAKAAAASVAKPQFTPAQLQKKKL